MTRDVDLTAAEWAVRRREGLSPGERREFDGWLGEHPAHWRAFKDSDRVWTDLAAMDLEALEDGVSRPRRRVLPRWAAVAATLVVAVAGAATYAATSGSAYATDRGEVRTVTLADGSQVTLGADSQIRVRMGEHGRDIQLRRGEAVFDVTHDAARPFRVRAVDTQVTVLGTRFVVKAAPDRVRVDVIRGAVKVEKAESPILEPFMDAPSGSERIVRGERLESRRGQAPKVLASIDPSAMATWMQGRLVYENATLAEVVGDLNRYSPRRVKLAGDELGALRVTAALRPDQVQQFLESLPSSLDVEVERENDGTLLVRPR